MVQPAIMTPQTNDASPIAASSPATAVQPVSTTSRINSVSSQETTSAPLQVVPIAVIGKYDKKVTTYALIDSGSDTTMIDKSLALQLGIEGESEIFFINTVTEKNVKGNASKANFRVFYIINFIKISVANHKV